MTLSAQHSYAMHLAVGHEQDAIREQDPMGTRKLAGERIRLWTVSSLPGAQHRGNFPSPEIDPTDDMTFGVGDI